MKSFLEKVVEDICAKQVFKDGDSVWIVPGKRVALFLKTYLNRHLKKTLWAPKIITINEFIESFCELEIIEGVRMPFELYSTHLQIEKKTPEPFDKFIKWGQILLADFNELDKYLVEKDNLYTDLKNVKDIENWSFNNEKLTENQERYLHFWDKIGQYYSVLNNQLLEKGKCYQGAAYKMVAEAFENKKVDTGNDFHFFIGFNALTKAEETIISALTKTNKGHVYWDVDTYYSDNNAQEAGLFFRRHTHAFGYENITWKEDLIRTQPKKIKMIGVPLQVGQAKVAGKLLSQIPKEESLTDTALILTDESSLFPVLYSLPENIDKVNITMGYPLINSSFYNLADQLFQLHYRSARYKKKGVVRFYYKDVLNLLNHPYIKKLFENNSEFKELEDLEQIIKKTNKVFVSPKWINEKLKERGLAKTLFPLFSPWEKIPTDVISTLKHLINACRDIFVKEDKEKINLEFTYYFSVALNKLESLLEEYDYIKSISSFKRLFFQFLRSEKLSFFGEPLEGLQLMGMLESRSLDFKKVILLGANEDKLPGAKSENSFIPFELKRFHGLPTHIEKDAIYSYYFYRLLHRAEELYFIYDTVADDFGGGEKSRFLTQIEFELNKSEYPLEIEHSFASAPTSKLDRKTEVEKEPWMIEKLDQLFENGISPSALNCYINCPLDFYHKYIIGLEEKEKVEETIEASSLGTFVHETLEEIYSPFLGRTINAQELEKSLSKVKEILKHNFLKEFSEEDLEGGKNLLTFQVAENFIKRFIKQEVQNLNNDPVPVCIVKLEEKMVSEKIIDVNGQPKKVKFRGDADRVDLKSGIIRVIDYKTGKVIPADLSVKVLDKITSNSKKSKAFQLFMYGYLFSKNHQDYENIQSGIFSMRNLSSGLLPLVRDGKKVLTKTDFEDFEVVLENLIKEIYDDSIPFTHERDAKYCLICE